MDVLLNALYTTSYVGSLFVLPSARTGGNRVDRTTGRPLTRDTPHVIRARLTGVSLSSLLSLGAAAYCISQTTSTTTAFGRIPELLGLWKPSLRTTSQLVKLVTLPLACTMSLFLGPLYTSAREGRLPGMRAFSWRMDVWNVATSLRGIRNYIVGPITEELVFRSCIVGTAAWYGRSTTHLIFVTPLYFGIAHAHHAYDVYVNGGRTRQSLQRGVFGALFQFIYTSLFGFHAAFLFLRTGSIVPPILSHVFCNLMGFPDLMGALQEADAQGKPGQKIVIGASYVMGIVAFSKTLWRFTEPGLFGGSIFW